MRPLLLDLFCGAGGAAMGYHRAGFDVIGVDIDPQPNYPFEFVQADALHPPFDLSRFDAIHASPPCQAYSTMSVMPNAGDYPELLEPTRQMLVKWDGPWVIENVPTAPLEDGPPSLFGDINGAVLCGSMFGLTTDEYELRRHRTFETNVPLSLPPECRHRRQVVGFYGDHARTRTRINGHHARGTDIVRKAEKLALVDSLMGIDWMDWHEATEAIPPAFTYWIGSQLIQALDN